MATLKDIAGATGVSIRTVNRALKAEKDVHPDVRAKVLAAAANLGYAPDLCARSLRTRRSYEVAVIVPSMDELHVAKLAGLEQAVRQSGHMLVALFATPAGMPQLEQALAACLERRPAGVVVLSPGDVAATEWLDTRLKQAGLTHMFIDVDVPSVDAVRIDRPQGVADAVGHLLGRGCRRIAYLGPHGSVSRLDGYCRAMIAAGRVPEHVVAVGGMAAAEQFAEARAVGRDLAGRPAADRPDAMQCFTDVMALGLMAGLRDNGLRVPQDMAVVGFDDRQAAATGSPPLTTIAQPSWESGRAAGELLLRKASAAPPPETGWSVLLPTRLVLRESA